LCARRGRVVGWLTSGLKSAGHSFFDSNTELQRLRLSPPLTRNNTNAQITNLLKENPRLQAAVEDMKKAGINVNDAVGKALQDSEVLKAIGRATHSVSVFADRATQPIRDTEAYKAIAASVEEAFDDAAGTALRYGGYSEKEERRRRREARASKAGKITKRVAENPE
jgi:import inner membrane translocase subunit TIM44